MLSIFRCPGCGSRVRVPGEQVGKKVRCAVCNRTFLAMPRDALGQEQSETERLAAKRASSPLIRLTQKTGDPSVMLDGAIGGAIGGILVGLLVGSIAAANKPVEETDIGGVFGGVLTGLFYGFIFGFLAGTLIGVLLGLFSKVIGYLFEFRSSRASVASGALAGAVVAMGFGDRRWALVGAVIGGVGAILWSLANGWAEGYMPPTPSKRLHQDLEDELEGSRRHSIEDTGMKYPGGASRYDPRGRRTW